MRASGYATGAFVSNPFAYYFTRDLENGFNVPAGASLPAGWTAAIVGCDRTVRQDSGIGSRMAEYWDLESVWNYLGRMPHNLSIRLRPEVSFEQARQVLAKLPDGFFLWIHVMAPHNPYLPDRADRGRFLPDAELRTYGRRILRSLVALLSLPDQQSQVDQRRLRYDEYIATADRAFGAFVSELEHSGKLGDTTVIVSSDHGESFEGGVYQHSSPGYGSARHPHSSIIRTPGQRDKTDGRRYGGPHSARSHDSRARWSVEDRVGCVVNPWCGG